MRITNSHLRDEGKTYSDALQMAVGGCSSWEAPLRLGSRCILLDLTEVKVMYSSTNCDIIKKRSCVNKDAGAVKEVSNVGKSNVSKLR